MKKLLIALAVGISVMGCDSQTITDSRVQHLQTYSSNIKSEIGLLNQDNAQFAFDTLIFNQRWEQFLKSLSDEQLVAMGNYEEAVAIGTIIDRAIARRALVKSFDQEHISQIHQFDSESDRLKGQRQQLEIQAKQLTRELYEFVEYSPPLLARQQQWPDQYRQTGINPP